MLLAMCEIVITTEITQPKYMAVAHSYQLY